MKNLFSKKNLLLLLFFILFGIIFFSYDIVLTWDTSEYIGLGSIIGSSDMVNKWIGHRNMAFPLLLKIFGIGNKTSFKIMLYIFYIAMIITITKIFSKCKRYNLFSKKISIVLGTILTVVFIILNPIIFGYYHTVLTEFVTSTLILICLYLAIKWLDLDYKENLKQAVLYAIGFAILAILIYHTKQSLIPSILAILMITSFLSIINEFCKKNILIRLGTFLFAIISVIITIFIWNCFMSDANVAEETTIQRLDNKLLNGITQLTKICDEESVEDVNLDELGISDESLQEVQNIIEGNSKYKKFSIYQNTAGKYYVYFSKNNSFKEQVVFYLKMCVLEPKTVSVSYYKGYKRILCIFDDFYLQQYYKENFSIGMRIFRKKSNIVDVNPDYESYVEKYKTDEMEDNVLTKEYNKFEFKLNKYITIITKYNFFVLPVMYAIIFILYLIFRKKMSVDTKRIVEYIIIFYTTCLSIVFTYVIMSFFVDRYAVPAMIPMFIADIMLILLIIKKLIYVLNMKKQKLLNN